MSITRGSRRWSSHLLIFTAALALLFVLPAPSPAGQKKSAVEDTLSEVEISDAELRILVRALAIPVSGVIEETVDQILELDLEPRQRQLALQWKINGLPAYQAALFQPDPLSALLDAWSLTAQIRDSHESGFHSGMPEDMRRLVLAGVDRVEQDVLSVARHLGPPEVVEGLRRSVETWADRHPLTGTIFTRFPTADELAELTADNRIGLRRAAAAVSATMDDLAVRLDTYGMYLPKQARWQAEYLAGEMTGSQDLETLIVEFTELSNAIERMTETVNSAPELIAAERGAVLQALQQERIAALEALNQQLAEALQFISHERIEIFTNHLQAERIAILEAIENERTIALEALHEERVAAIEQLGAVTGQVVDESLKGLVDHFFLRLVQLAAVALALLLIGWLVLRRRRVAA